MRDDRDDQVTPAAGARLTSGILPFHQGEPRPYLLMEPNDAPSMGEQGEGSALLFAANMCALGLPHLDDLMCPQPTLPGWAVLHHPGSGRVTVLSPDRAAGCPRQVLAEGAAPRRSRWHQLAARRGRVLLLAGMTGAASATGEDERIWSIHQAAVDNLLTGAEVLVTSPVERIGDRRARASSVRSMN